MTKFVLDAALDAYLAYIADLGDKLIICSTAPTTFTEANVTYNLGAVTLTEGGGNGDYTIGNGDTNGRKLTVAQQTGISVTASATATHIAIVDSVGSVLLVVTSLSSSQAVTSGNTATVNAFDLEVADAA